MATDRNALKDKLIENLVIIGAIYYFAVKPIFEKLGITKTPEDTTIDDVSNLTPQKNAWSGKAFIPKNVQVLLLTSSAKSSYAKTIYDALNGFFGDDENKVIAIIRSLKTQSQVADLAEYFRLTYKLDLLDTIRNGTEFAKTWRPLTAGLSNDQVSEIIRIINAKPKYNV